MASASPDGGKGSSGTEALAAQVLQMRDDLTKVAYAGNVGDTRSDFGKLSPVLADIAAGKRYTVQTDTQQLAGLAKAGPTSPPGCWTTPRRRRASCRRCRCRSRPRTCPGR